MIDRAPLKIDYAALETHNHLAVVLIIKLTASLMVIYKSQKCQHTYTKIHIIKHLEKTIYTFVLNIVKSNKNQPIVEGLAGTMVPNFTKLEPCFRDTMSIDDFPQLINLSHT